MKTRTNQVIAMLVVASMLTLTTSQINTLSAGDIVLKQDESGYHAYLVSYKKDGTGICLTYTDASCVETVSYDLVDGEWVYNSTDLTPLGASGTKLYLHDIYCDNESVEITLVSTKSQPFSPQTSIIDVLNEETSLKATLNSSNGEMIMNAIDDYIYYINSNGDVVKQQLTYEDISSDEVSEL